MVRIINFQFVIEEIVKLMIKLNIRVTSVTIESIRFILYDFRFHFFVNFLLRKLSFLQKEVLEKFH